MKKYIFNRSDGIITISNIVDPTQIDAIIKKWEMVHPGVAILSHKEVDNIPPDRTFRDAWEDDGKKVKVNLPKAQNIHMDRIRVVRNAELAKLDIPQMTAISKGDTTEAANIESKKQKLRDLPTMFDLKKAKTADELKTLWPPELPKP